MCISLVLPVSAAIFLERCNQKYTYFAWCTLLVSLDASRNTATFGTSLKYI